MPNKTILKRILTGFIVGFIFFSFISRFLKDIPSKLLSPLPSQFSFLRQKNSNAEKTKKTEVFGFAPYWNFDKLENINFSTLTTLAYFDIPVLSDGSFDVNSPGYRTFDSDKAKEFFQKAQNWQTKVVVTLTQMDRYDIICFLDNEEAQRFLTKQAVDIVKKNGLDGINIDFEYISNPGEDYRKKFSDFVFMLTSEMHNNVPNSQVSVSVLASSVKDLKLYDIKTLSQNSDAIFMMAYDFANANSETAMPTAPLNGHETGKYWYDISYAVSDFLTQMPPEKLILGLPWYGYDYPVYTAKVNSATYKGYYSYYWYRYRKYWTYVKPPTKVTFYSDAQDSIKPEQEGWDDDGKVSWVSYTDESGYTRMLFMEDVKSLKLKYDFAKDKKLAGVGIWALGYDEGKTELWDLLSEEFGVKFAENSMPGKKDSI